MRPVSLVCQLPSCGAVHRGVLVSLLAVVGSPDWVLAQAYDGPTPTFPEEPAPLYRLPGQWSYAPPVPEMEAILEPFVREVFSPTEQIPMFPGGPGALRQFLQQHLHYPAARVEGQVLVEFFVEEDGRISEAKVIRRLHPLFDAEALRVVKAMPPWRSAWRNGRPARVGYTLPITFRLSPDGPTAMPTPAASRR